MSHITTVKTQFNCVESMKLALKKLGFEVVTSKFNLLTVKDYYGKLQPKKVCIRAWRKTPDGQLSGQSELGFSREADNTLSLIADNMDVDPAHCLEVKPWAKALKKVYSYEVTMAAIRRKGYVIASESVDANKHIHVTVRRTYE